MATGKRAPKKTAKKRPSGRGKTTRKGVSPLIRVRDGLTGAVTREAVGVFLLAVGLFYSAAFASGRGAFLGDAGAFVADHLLGVLGLALAPIVAVFGLLLLLGRLSGRLVAGTVLLLLAGAASFAAALHHGQLFSVKHYPDAGGLLGSGLYAAVQGIGGAIGAAVVIGLLYLLGLSLVTTVSFAAAMGALKTVLAHVAGWSRDLLSRLKEWRAGRPDPSRKSATTGDRGSRSREKSDEPGPGVPDL